MIQRHSIYKVILEDRNDCEVCVPRMRNVEIRIGDNDADLHGSSANPLCYRLTKTPTTTTSEFPCPHAMIGRYALARRQEVGYWHIREFRIFTSSG